MIAVGGGGGGWEEDEAVEVVMPFFEVVVDAILADFTTQSIYG